MCKKINVKIHTYMCVCLFLMYLYTYIYIYFNEQKKPDFFVTVSWLTYAQSYSAHTSSETYVVAEALVRALSNVFSNVYYCHWKTTLIFFSVRAFIGSFFSTQTHGFSENLLKF